MLYFPMGEADKGFCCFPLHALEEESTGSLLLSLSPGLPLGHGDSPRGQTEGGGLGIPWLAH